MGNDNSVAIIGMMVVVVAGVFGFMYLRKGDGSIPNPSQDYVSPYPYPYQTVGINGIVAPIPGIVSVNYDIDDGRWRRRNRWYPYLSDLRYWGLYGGDIDDFVEWIEDHDRDDDDIEKWIKKRLRKRRKNFRDRDWDDYKGRNWSSRENRRYRDRDGREYNKRGGSHDYKRNEWSDNNNGYSRTAWDKLTGRDGDGDRDRDRSNRDFGDRGQRQNQDNITTITDNNDDNGGRDRSGNGSGRRYQF